MTAQHLTWAKPQKQDGEFVAALVGPTERDRYFQLPKSFIVLDPESKKATLSFRPGKTAAFVEEYIRQCETAGKNQCHASSADWFKGKIFPLDHIERVFNSSISIKDGAVVVNVDYNPDSLAVFDHFKHLVPHDPGKLTFKGSSIICFSGLAFKGKSIRSIFHLKQIRLPFEPPQETKKPKTFLLEDPVVSVVPPQLQLPSPPKPSAGAGSVVTLPDPASFGGGSGGSGNESFEDLIG